MIGVFKMAELSVYEGIMQGLSEAIEYKERKNTKARVRVLSTVDPIQIPNYKAADVANLRKDLNMSQKSLAAIIGVSKRTVESWEAGKSVPSGIATRILYLIMADHSLVDKLVSM